MSVVPHAFRQAHEMSTLPHALPMAGSLVGHGGGAVHGSAARSVHALAMPSFSHQMTV